MDIVALWALFVLCNIGVAESLRYSVAGGPGCGLATEMKTGGEAQEGEDGSLAVVAGADPQPPCSVYPVRSYLGPLKVASPPLCFTNDNFAVAEDNGLDPVTRPVAAVFVDGCEGSSAGSDPANFWLGATTSTGANANFVVDLGCSDDVNKVWLRNTHNGSGNSRSTKDFTVSVSVDNASFQVVAQGTLADARNVACSDIPLELFYFSATVRARYFKFTVDSYYGLGGGLKYFRLGN